MPETADKCSLARCTQQRRKVALLGLEQLLDLWVQHYDKLAKEDKKLLPLRPAYYLAPAE